MSSLAPRKVAETIKKREAIKYDKSWNLRLSHLMGMYSTYFDSNQQYRALWMLNSALAFIQNDRQHRMFFDKQKQALDFDPMLDFDDRAKEFRRLFGTEKVDLKAIDDEVGMIRRRLDKLADRRFSHPSDLEETDRLQKQLEELEEEARFSYTDLRTSAPPIPDEDKVYIGRAVPIAIAWEKYPSAYIAFRVGFVYSVQVMQPTPSGAMFPTQQLIPMLDFNDSNAINYHSNCVPYSYYHGQKTALLRVLMPCVFELETIIAQYLHNEGFLDFNAKQRQGVMADSAWQEDVEKRELDESDGTNE